MTMPAPVTSSEQPSPQEVLEEGLIARWGRRARITGIAREPLYSFSTHPIYRLRVMLASGEQLSVIFKSLRPAPNRYVRREVLLFERLLGNARFGAPLLYASLCDTEHGCYWLFVEDVGDWKLKYCDVDEWTAAFRWMADMHAAYYGREEELRALDCLGEHDAAFYHGLAAAVRHNLQHLGTPPAAVRFDRLMRQLNSVIGYLVSRPRTLVHGDLWCDNIAVGPAARIRPVDWEWAAIGLPAWDLSKLLMGWGSEKARFAEAYLEEFERRSDVFLDRGEFQRVLAYCKALQLLWCLRWWSRGCENPEFVDGLLGKIERLWDGWGEEGTIG